MMRKKDQSSWKFKGPVQTIYLLKPVNFDSYILKNKLAN